MRARERVAERVTFVQEGSCACTDRVPCCWHYAQLTPLQRIGVRRLLGFDYHAGAGSSSITRAQRCEWTERPARATR